MNFNTAIRPEFFASQAAILNTILVTSEYGVLLTDLDHQSIACNPRFGELFGLDIHEVVKSNAGVVREMVQKRIVDLDTWLANLELIYNDPLATQTDQLSLVNPVQKLRRTTMSVKDEGGEVVGRLWSFFDVTQSTYEQSLRENLYQFSQMVDPDPGHVYREIVERIGSFYDSICLLSLQDGDFLQFRAVGGPPSIAREMTGNKMADSYCQLCLQLAEPLVIQDARKHPEASGILPCQLGLTRYLGVPITLPSGVIVGTLCILDGRSEEAILDADIDFLVMCATRIAAEIFRETMIDDRLNRQRAAEAGREQELLRTKYALNAIQASVSSITGRETIDEVCSRLAQTLNGFGGIQIEKIRAFISPDTRDMDHNCFPLALPESYFGVLEIKAGEPVGSGQSVYVSALVQHICLLLTRHILSEKLRKSDDALVMAENKIVQQEKLAVSGTLAASIAHDIRNILASLSFDLANEIPDERSWKRIKVQMERFEVLNHRLLVYAQPSEHRHEVVNLEKICGEVLMLLEPISRAYSVDLRADGLDQLHPMLGDKALIEHLFVNLALNAIESMADRGGSVLMVGDCSKTHNRIFVKDTGPGIPLHVMNGLFQPFVTSRQNGFGLGLYSCRRIAKEHAGSLNLISSNANGTSFEVQFPIISTVISP